MGNRQKSGIEDRRTSDVSEVVDFGEPSFVGEQVGPTQNRLSRHSAPEPRNQLGKSPQSRVSFDSEPPTTYAPPRTPRKRRFPSNDESGESATSDIEGCRQPDSRRRVGNKNTRPKLESQPSFTHASGIFGTESPIPLRRDQVVNDLSVMAESIADALGKEAKVGKLPARRMNSFTAEVLLGFGEYRASFASCADGAKLVDTIQRVAFSQRHDLYRYGFRFSSPRPCVWRLRRRILDLMPIRPKRAIVC